MAAVLCYGDNGKILTSSIRSYDKICSGEISFHDLHNESKEFEVETVSYTIRNKYFSAELHLKAYRSNEHPSFQDVLNAAEACILTTSSKMDEIPLNDDICQIGQLAAELNIPVRLLVSIKNQQNELMTSTHRDNRILWCLDNGFEYIEIDSLSPTQSHNLREKDGLPRLIEALNSNMWSNMDRVVPSSSRTPISGTVFSTPVESSNEISSSIHNLTVTPTQESTVLAETVVPVSHSEPTNQDHQEDELFIQLLQSNETNLSAVGEDVDNDEKVWDSFNDVITQARVIRNEAVGGNLSDDERRRRAAELAMRLCAVMDFDESSDDGEA